MEKTKAGIFYLLNESEYKYRYKDFEFYFSSLYYRNKFENRLELYVNEERLNLSFKLKCEIDSELYHVFKLYEEIEKRGFYVKHKDKEFLQTPKFKIELGE